MTLENKQVFIVERKYVRREYYFAILQDRKTQGPVVVASSQGGVDIEGVAAENPEAIIKLPIDINTGLTSENAKYLVEKLGFSSKVHDDVFKSSSVFYFSFLLYKKKLMKRNVICRLSI